MHNADIKGNCNPHYTQLDTMHNRNSLHCEFKLNQLRLLRLPLCLCLPHTPHVFAALWSSHLGHSQGL